MLIEYDSKPKPQGLNFPVEKKELLELLSKGLPSKPKLTCVFETDKFFCEIAQNGEMCNLNLFNACYNASKKENDDLTPEQFCKENPSLTIDQAIVLREMHLAVMPDEKKPLCFYSKKVQTLTPTELEELKKTANAIIKLLNDPKTILSQPIVDNSPKVIY